MSLSRKALALMFGIALMSNTAWAAAGGDDDGVHDDQSKDECERTNQMKTSTVYGGTGLFNTYSTRTLDSGEYTVGTFFNNFDRDPGDIDINQATINLTVGLAERWEVWANLNAWQQVTVRQPFLLSSYGYNAVLASGRSPYVFFGPAFGGTDGGAAFFPGTGALGGGILPVLGRFGSPIVTTGDLIIDDFGQPGGAIFGPAIVTDRASYYPDLPFLGQVDTFGFDNFGRPVFGPRASGNGLGDASVGTKIEIIDPDDNWFSMAVGGTVTIPTARNSRALARGRTAGEVDFGPFLAFGQEFGEDKWFRIYENVSYTFTGDPDVGDIEVLDRPNKVGLGVGLSLAPTDHVELIGEVNSTHFIGGQTPNFNQRDPVDLTVGARFFFLDGQISFGGAYRRLLNAQDDITVPVLNLTGFRFVPAPPPTVQTIPVFNFANQTFDSGDHNGYVAYFGFGNRKECEEDRPDNQPPVCTGITADRSEVIVGESVGLTANASDPDGDVLVYTWTATGGRVVGSGASVTFDTTGLAEGTYTITAQVDDGFGHIVDCAATVITVRPRPNQCPQVTLSADKYSVTAGEIVTFTATATDPDNGPGPISYNWTTSQGSLQGSGTSATLDTTGLNGSITVTVSVSDTDPACTDTESVTINIENIPPPEIVKLTDLYFPRNNARINNEHKAILDDAALRMQQDPRLMLVIDGHSDTGERAGIAQKRAENARDYIVNEKGIDPNRVIVRSFDDKCPSTDSNSNRRVELYLLPEGRTADAIQKNCAGGAMQP